MHWRVIVELSSAVAAKQVHEVHVGGNAMPGCSATTLGLSLAEFHLAMRIHHVAQAVKGWPDNRNEDRQEGARFADAVEHVRWRLWHGQVHLI